MKNKKALKEEACHAIEQNRERIIRLGQAVAAEPELGFKEYKTADKFKSLLDELGCGYRSGVARTGVIARCKGADSKLNIAVMGELDAVAVPGHPNADPATGAVHACGHNAMMAMLGGVAIALHKSSVMESLDGDVTLMAVPAEEYIEMEFRDSLREKGEIWFFGGKQEFIRLGEMDDVDMMLMQHSAVTNGEYMAGAYSECNGFSAKLIRYIGKEAHAGAAPHEGVNALNAATLGLMGIHAQRETFRDEDRIRVHPIITRGGSLVNIVPSDVRMETYVRGRTAASIMDACAKVDRALKAGGDAVGAQTIIKDIPGYLPSVMNEPLCKLLVENLNQLLGAENVRMRCPGLGGGSTDQGDVSQLMPSVHAYFGGISGGLHSEQFCIADPELAYIVPAKAMCMLLIDLLCDGAKEGLAIKKNHVPAMTKEEYLSKWGGLGK